MDIIGINLNEKKQLSTLEGFKKYYEQIPFTDEKSNSLRYYFNNDWYSYCDSIFLYSIIRDVKPKNIIEVGSGFSSAVIMDVNDLFFNSEIYLQFIEPNTDRLFSIMNTNDKIKNKVYQSNVESLPTDIFEILGEGDILFIDSSHEFLYGNDLYYIFFEILPKLKKGVLIHFHDIFYPFKYSDATIEAKLSWNEVYFLKSFLMYNDSFEIKIFSDFIAKNYTEKLNELPLCLKNTGGSIWIEKIK